MSHVEESKEQLSLHSDKSSTSSLPLSASTSTSSSSPASLPPSDVQLRPSYSNMFKPRQVESLMRSYVEEYLRDKQYDANESSLWAKDMAANIKNKLKGATEQPHHSASLHTTRGRAHWTRCSQASAAYVAVCAHCVCRSELKLPRYKYLVQVTIGENKGAGVRCGARCFWDQTTDKLAQTHYVNVRLSHNTQHAAGCCSSTCLQFGIALTLSLRIRCCRTCSGYDVLRCGCIRSVPVLMAGYNPTSTNNASDFTHQAVHGYTAAPVNLLFVFHTAASR